MRIGILGGTFDPPHAGHLALAEAAQRELSLDEVLFLPANRNPLKSDRRQTRARHRLEMVRLAIEGREGFSVSDIEIARGGLSFAVDSLKALRQARPAEYWFLLGADGLRTLPTWKRPDKLLKLCRLGVAIRPPETVEEALSRVPPAFRERVDPIPMKPVRMSSTEIREWIEDGRLPPHSVPAKVLQYIRENGLYGS